MRRIIPLVSLVLLLAVPIAANAQDAATRAIEKVLYDQQAAWNAGDIETFMHGYQDLVRDHFHRKNHRKRLLEHSRTLPQDLCQS